MESRNGVSQVLKMIDSGLLELTKENVKRLDELSTLNDWLSELKMIFWQNKMKLALKSVIVCNSIVEEEEKQALYCLLEEVCNQLLKECRGGLHSSLTWDDFSLRCQQRCYDSDSTDDGIESDVRREEVILELILKDSNTSETIKNLFSCADDENHLFGPKLLIPIKEERIKEWLKNNQLPNKFIIQENLNEFLDVFDWFIKLKLGYTLRHSTVDNPRSAGKRSSSRIQDEEKPTGSSVDK